MVQASAENLNLYLTKNLIKKAHTDPAEKERVVSVPQSEQLPKTPEPPLPNGKRTEPSVQITRS